MPISRIFVKSAAWPYSLAQKLTMSRIAFSIGASKPPWMWGFIMTEVPCRGGSISYTNRWGTVFPSRSTYMVTFMGTPLKLSARRSASIAAMSVYSICSRTRPSVCKYSILPMGKAGSASASSASWRSTSTSKGTSPAGSSTSGATSTSRRYLSFKGFSFSKSKNSCLG